MNKKDALQEIKLVEQTINKEKLLENLKFDISHGTFMFRPPEAYLEDLNTIKVCIEFLEDYIDPDRYDDYEEE